MAKKIKISEKDGGAKSSSRYGYQGNQRSRFGFDSSMDDGSYADVLEDTKEPGTSEAGLGPNPEAQLLKLFKQISRQLNEAPAPARQRDSLSDKKKVEEQTRVQDGDKPKQEEEKNPAVEGKKTEEISDSKQKDEPKPSPLKSPTSNDSVRPGGPKPTEGPQTQELTPAKASSEEGKDDQQPQPAEGKASSPAGNSAARVTDMNDASKDGGVARMEQKDKQAQDTEKNHLESVSESKVHKGSASISHLGTNEKKKEDAGTKLNKTKGAVEEKKTDKEAEANTHQVKTVDEEKKAEVKKDDAKQTLDTALQNSLPEKVEDVDNFHDDGVASKIGDQVKQTIEEKTKDVSGTFETLDKTPAPGEPKKSVPFEPLEQADPTPEMNVGKGLVPKVDENSINLDSYVEESDSLLKREGIKQEHLDLATSGDLAEAKKIQGNIESKAADAPQNIRKEEQEIHGSNEAELKAKEDHVKDKMKKERDAHLTGARGMQTGTKDDLEKKKEEVTNHINKIYEDTNKAVQEKLDNLKKNSLETFAREEASASATFEGNVKERMDKFKDERYEGASGLLKKGYDWLMGIDDLPEVKTIFEEEKTAYVTKIDAAITKIISDSQRVVEECKSLISQARTEIDNYVKGLSPALQKIGEEAEKEIQKKLDELDEKVNKAASELRELMDKKRAEAIANIDKKIEAMKEEMSGFLSQMGDLLLDAALKFFKWALEAAGHSADEIMAIINKGKAVLTAIVSDPVKFLKNLASAVGGGIKSFGANIQKHLGEGFMTWLTGQLNSLPIQLPEKFDLKGIFSLVMQVLGLTYANLRGKLSDKVGEDKVALAEKSVDVVMEVKEKGPIAMYDMMADKADSIKTEFIEGAKEWAIGAMIKQGLIRLATMLNPAGAIVQAVLAIYNGVIFFVNNWDRIMDFVNSIFDSIASIANGAISTASAFVEKTMAKTIPLILDFIAQQLNLSGIAERITKIIHRIRKPIDEVIDKVIAFITNKVKKIAGKILGKDKDKKKDGKHSPEDHKEDKEQTKKDFEKDKGDDKTTDVDRKEHEKIGKEIKRRLETTTSDKETDPKKFYKEKSELARSLEKEYQPALKNSNRLKISYDDLQKTETDHGFDFHILITANNFDIYGEAKFHDLLLPDNLIVGDSIKYSSCPSGFNIDPELIYKISSISKPNVIIKGSNEKSLSISVESLILHYQNGLISEVSPTENKEVFDRCNEILGQIDMETISIPISGDAPRLEEDMRFRYENLFEKYDSIKIKIEEHSKSINKSDLIRIKDIKKNVDLLRQIIETRLVTGLNDPKEGLGNSNFAYGYYSVKIDNEILEANNFSSISSKYLPAKTKEKIEWKDVKFMLEVHRNMKLIFSPVRTLGDPGFGKDSSQDSERKLVSYIYDVVIAKITGIAKEKLNNPQQFSGERRKQAEEDGAKRVSGEVHIFTEMSPCSACDNAIAKLKNMFPNLAVNVKYGVNYDINK